MMIHGIFWTYPVCTTGHSMLRWWDWSQEQWGCNSSGRSTGIRSRWRPSRERHWTEGCRCSISPELIFLFSNFIFRLSYIVEPDSKEHHRIWHIVHREWKGWSGWLEARERGNSSSRANWANRKDSNGQVSGQECHLHDGRESATYFYHLSCVALEIRCCLMSDHTDK